MYQIKPITGEDLPDKTLCLTYDDGPGEHSVNIGNFLREQDVPAAFFVVGKYAAHHPEILRVLKKQGHLIANHTYDHPDIPYYVSVNGNICDQVIRTDDTIREVIGDGPIFFRAPYGKWSPESAYALNKSRVASENHFGPVHWEIGGIDCHFWKNDQSVEAAAEHYLSEIEARRKGIIVMHDEIADMDFLKPKNKTLALTMQLIPLLKAKGYQFIRLDKIPAALQALRANAPIVLRTSAGKQLIIKENGEVCTTTTGSAALALQIRELGYGKVAMQAVGGQYLSVAGPGENLVGTLQKRDAETGSFDLIPVNGAQVMLRAWNGKFIAVQKNGQLAATANFMRLATRFYLGSAGNGSSPGLAFFDRCSTLVKRMMYVKTKLLER